LKLSVGVPAKAIGVITMHRNDNLPANHAGIQL